MEGARAVHGEGDRRVAVVEDAAGGGFGDPAGLGATHRDPQAGAGDPGGEDRVDRLGGHVDRATGGRLNGRGARIGAAERDQGAADLVEPGADPRRSAGREVHGGGGAPARGAPAEAGEVLARGAATGRPRSLVSAGASARSSVSTRSTEASSFFRLWAFAARSAPSWVQKAQPAAIATTST